MTTIPLEYGIFNLLNKTLPFPVGGGLANEIALWIIAISFLVSTIISILAYMGLAQGLQVRFLKRNIEARLRVLESYAIGARDQAKRYLESIGAEEAEDTINTIIDYFSIEPVTIEPTDITKRLERVLRSEEERIEGIVRRRAAKADETQRKIAITLLAIANALNIVYKQVRHLLLWGLKTNNPYIILQLWMQLPVIMRIAKAYYDATRCIAEHKPIGDAAGPLVAYRLMRQLRMITPPREIAKDTLYSVHEYNGRRVIIVKAKGPGSTVGKPGEAVEKLARIYKDTLRTIITVDAALKFEGEDSGTIAEGAGVAMGDPGPEKIRIERVAYQLRIPLHAIVIKMSLEEAIQTMKKEIAEGVEKAVEKVKRIIEEETKPGDTIIVVGVGNTLGVGQ